MKWVYVYLDSAGRVVYVGSGHFDRMYRQSQPRVFKTARASKAMREWMQAGNAWTRHRVVGPVSDEIAKCWERALILDNVTTVLNERCPITQKYLFRREFRFQKYKRKTPPKFRKAHIETVTTRNGVICGWRFGTGKVRRLFCQAVLDSKSRGGIIEVEGKSTWNHSVSIEIDPPG